MIYMKIFLTIVWSVFAILFIMLGLYHWNTSKRDIPPFQLSERPLSNKATIIILGKDIDQPIKDFVKDFNAHLDKQNKSSHDQNRNSALGFFIASLASILSIIIEWRQKIGIFLKKITI